MASNLEACKVIYHFLNLNCKSIWKRFLYANNDLKSLNIINVGHCCFKILQMFRPNKYEDFRRQNQKCSEL